MRKRKRTTECGDSGNASLPGDIDIAWTSDKKQKAVGRTVAHYFTATFSKHIEGFGQALLSDCFTAHLSS